MDLDSLDDDDAQALAERIGPHLDPGSYGDRVVLTKRQFIAAASGTLGAGALATWGVDDATAQAAGSVGTSSDPVDVNAYDLNVANSVTSSLPMNGNDIENVGSVSADEATIGEHDTITSVELGDVGTGGLTLSAGQSATQTSTFDTGFDSEPVVFLTAGEFNTQNYILPSVRGVTTTDVDIGLVNIDDNNSHSAGRVNYLAIEIL